MSSPHKCSQKIGYSVFNAVTTIFLQIFCAFLPSFLIHRTHPLLSFLEGSSSCWDTDLRYASRIREDFPPRTFLLELLNYKALGWAFTIYWQSPRMSYCPRIGPWPNILFRALTPTIFMWFGNLLMSLFTRKKNTRCGGAIFSLITTHQILI